MTRAGRRLAVLGAVLAVAASASACKVLRRASAPSALTTAAANAVQVPAAGDCPFDVAVVDAAVGGRWTVSGLPSGGCTYTRGSRTILVSAVPLPTDAAGRQAALARVRNSCDAGSTKPVRVDGFVCRQDSLVEAATIFGDHLLVLCTAAGPDAAQVPGIRAQLATLLSRAG